MEYNKFRTGQFKKARWINLTPPAIVALSNENSSPDRQIFFPADRKVFADPFIYKSILQKHIQYKN